MLSKMLKVKFESLTKFFCIIEPLNHLIHLVYKKNNLYISLLYLLITLLLIICLFFIFIYFLTPRIAH